MDRNSSLAAESLAGGNITFLFQRDSLITGRYFSDRVGKTLVPEKKLMLAVLEDALGCFQDHCSAKHGKRKQLYDNVHQWFFDPADDRVFSFSNICSALGFEPDYIRKGLAQWRKKESSKPRRTSTGKFTNRASELRL